MCFPLHVPVSFPILVLVVVVISSSLLYHPTATHSTRKQVHVCGFFTLACWQYHRENLLTVGERRNGVLDGPTNSSSTLSLRGPCRAQPPYLLRRSGSSDSVFLRLIPAHIHTHTRCSAHANVAHCVGPLLYTSPALARSESARAPSLWVLSFNSFFCSFSISVLLPRLEI